MDVQAAFASTGVQGFLSLPDALYSGDCIDSVPVKYLVNERHGCNRRFVLAQACASGQPLDVGYYLGGVSVLSTPTGTGTVPIQVNSISCRQGVTCPQSTLPASFVSVATSLPSPLTQNGVCTNVLQSLNYTIVYDNTAQTPTIQSIQVDLVFGVTGATSVAQTFAVFFQSKSSSGQIYSRSGNPGYTIGSPVLAGTKALSGGKSAIAYTPNPAYGPSLASTRPDTNQCTGNTVTDLAYRVPVTFGEDTASGCVLYYTLGDLTNNCGTIKQTVLNAQMGANNALITHFGRFGNSSQLDISQWVEISGTTPPSAVSLCDIYAHLLTNCTGRRCFKSTGHMLVGPNKF